MQLSGLKIGAWVYGLFWCYVVALGLDKKYCFFFFFSFFFTLVLLPLEYHLRLAFKLLIWGLKVLCVSTRKVFILSQSYLPFIIFKKHIYLTISVSLRHEHDLNLAAFMVVLILPCNFTYKDAAAWTSLFNRVLPQDEYVVILLIFARNVIVSLKDYLM